ncbi:MAG: bifunctional diguanylate cyclase/phosphodiesterase [Cyanobium sp. M30B3]|nr:MAG: bifunctional diguanylate cyclase/phosphodiesterase [Cyanobium sp. M30B3]
MSTPRADSESSLVRELRRSLARLELALAQISDALVITDASGCLLWCNGRFEQLLKLPRLQLLGCRLDQVLDTRLAGDSCLNLQDLLEQRPNGGMVSLALEREPLQVMELEWRPVQSERPAPYVFSFHDVSDRESLQALQLQSRQLVDEQLALAQQVVTCPVTGLPNRRGFARAIQAALQHLERHPTWLAVLFCDLNRFKEVNDTYGHQVGDQLLIALAQRMQQVIRADDVLARLGGDEFVLLCTELESPEEALRIAERLRQVVARPWTPESSGTALEIHPEISIGISFSEHGLESPDQLLHDADLAMYEAKSRPDRQIVVYDSAISSQLNRRIAIRRSLQAALQSQTLPMHFQPWVCLERAAVLGYEALVRPRDLQGEPIDPAELIAVAESSGLMTALGQLVLEQSLLTLDQFGVLANRPSLAVNFSPQQLARPGFAADVLALARRLQVQPRQLCIEVTETALIDHPQRTREELVSLRDAGFRVFLDDFGTGYSSLNWLAELPIDGVKIDRSFTATMLEDPRRHSLVAAILRLAADLDLEVVAEGIERTDQWQALRQMGCRLGQGYLFSRPLPAGQLGQLPAVLLPAAC